MVPDVKTNEILRFKLFGAGPQFLQEQGPHVTPITYTCWYTSTRRRTAGGTRMSASAVGVSALVAAALALAYAAFNTIAPELAALREAEASVESASQAWELAVSTEAETELQHALELFERSLQLALLGPSTSADSLSAFFHWLALPMRLSCLYHLATASMLLNKENAVVLQAHKAMLQEGYCDLELRGESTRREYAACIAPLARATVLFAATPSEADVAFDQALLLLGPDGRPALSWTSRLQLPEHHTPSLVANPWWAGHPAVEMLEAAYPEILAEFDSDPRAQAGRAGGGDEAAATSYIRRRVDAFVATPTVGWGRVTANCTSAPVTCAMVKRLQPTAVGSRPTAAGGRTDSTPNVCLAPAGNVVPCSASEGGARKALSRAAHYYMLRSGARLRARVGTTNERLTCHLALRGTGAWLTVGEKAREIQPGRAMCFDDSFTHSAAHGGSETSYVLQIHVPHPDLAHVPAG